METQTLPLTLPEGRLKLVFKDLSLLLNGSLGDGSEFRPLVYVFYKNCKGHRIFLNPPGLYSDYLKNDNCIRVLGDYIQSINRNPESAKIESYCYVENIQIENEDKGKAVNALMVHWANDEYAQGSYMLRYNFVGGEPILETAMQCFFLPTYDCEDRREFHNLFLPIGIQTEMFPDLARRPMGFAVNHQPN